MIRKLTTYLLLLLVFGISITNAQLSGTYYVGQGQQYSTLTKNNGLFSDINTNGLSGNVIAYVTSDLNEDGSRPINRWSEFGGSNYTVTIKPFDASEKLIFSNSANGTIILNGARNVTIDGSSGGSGKYLRIRCSNNNVSTITFSNGASKNTLTNCYVEGNNITTTGTSNLGTIFFGSTTGTQGNDSNTISNCDIRDRSDATGYPAYAIYSYSTAGSSAQYNISNSIISNNIYNFWEDGDFCGGIYITIGSGNGWAINGNSFYQTVPRNSVSAITGGWNIIFLNFTGINNCTVSNNFIGGSGPLCSGAPWTATSTTALQLPAIRLFVGSTIASNIQGNTISNINFTSTANANNGLPFVAILAQVGNVNISNNTIGSSIGSNNISVNIAGTGNFTQTVRGIDQRGSGNILNNTVGSITLSGTITNTFTFDGISYISNPGSNINISNNTIGNSTVSKSIFVTSSILPAVLNGINSGVIGSSSTISNNIIANLTSNSTNSNSAIYSLIHTGSGSASITGNSIHDINSSNTNETNTGVLGILNTSSASNQTISSNTIYGLRATTSSNVNNNITGIDIEGSTGSGSIGNNRIYDLTNSSTGASPSIYGIKAFWGSWTALNNQVTITNGEATYNVNNKEKTENNHTVCRVLSCTRSNINNGIGSITANNSTFSNTTGQNINSESKQISFGIDATNGIQIFGIVDASGGTWNYYYNSVYIGGTASTGSSNSYCYIRTNNTTVSLRNNLFFNARTGGSGSHYAIANNYTTPTTNWPNTASNYNLLVSANPNKIGEWGSGTNRTINQWRTSSGGDNSSWSSTSDSIIASNLFTSIADGNLNIKPGLGATWYVNGKGIALPTYGTDFNGNSRSMTVTTGATDIGSNEYTPSSIPILATQVGIISPGSTTIYNFANRTISSITWGNSGTNPSSINIYYFSGTNPPNSVSGALYSNAYWLINATGGSGYTYNIVINYDLAIQGTIISENNIRIAKSDDNGITWQPYLTQGSGSGQYQLNTVNKTITLNGLNSFSLFTLTDNSAPLPVVLSSFGAQTLGRDINLIWKTTHEINNSGFALERIANFNNSGYTDWAQVSFLSGHGNSYSEQSYAYTDRKLASGKYKYRLKQIDYNGNYEYFNLNEPDEILIGAPLQFDISQNYPNPSNPNTKIDYQLPFSANVSLKVYDATGREVVTLVNQNQEAGYYSVEFIGNSFSSGIYFYEFSAVGNGQKLHKAMKMVLKK